MYDLKAHYQTTNESKSDEPTILAFALAGILRLVMQYFAETDHNSEFCVGKSYLGLLDNSKN